MRCKISYVTGVTHGITQSFFSNGNIRSVMPFSKGRMDGQGYAWNEEGEKLFGYKYHNGNFREGEYYCDDESDYGKNSCKNKRLRELGLDKIEGKRGTDNTFTWFNFLSCGDAGWTKGELYDDS